MYWMSTEIVVNHLDDVKSIVQSLGACQQCCA